MSMKEGNETKDTEIGKKEINSMQMIEWILIALATFFTIVSGVDYIVKNKNVLKG